MEPVVWLVDAEPAGPGQVVDEVGEPVLDVEPAVPVLVLGVLGLVVALVLGVRWVRVLGVGLDVVVAAGALDDRPLGVPGEAVGDVSDVLAVLGVAPVVRVQPGPWLLGTLAGFRGSLALLSPLAWQVMQVLTLLSPALVSAWVMPWFLSPMSSVSAW